jgi:hypothetical protein
MGKINGVVKDRYGNVLEHAEVLFADRAYNVLSSGYSNEDGEYYIMVNEKTNGIIVGTHSYGEDFLAFTFANVSTHIPHHIDVVLGNVEFLNFSRLVTGNREEYTCSFQLASLERMKRGDRHLSPEFFRESLKVSVGGVTLDSYEIRSEIIEVEGGKITMDAYELSFPSSVKDRGKVFVLTYEIGNSYGMLKSYL